MGKPVLRRVDPEKGSMQALEVRSGWFGKEILRVYLDEGAGAREYSEYVMSLWP